MTPEQIRDLYARATSATDDEAGGVFADLAHDPELARAFLTTSFALTKSDRDIAAVVGLALGEILMLMIEERADGDDTFALEAAGRIRALMERVGPPHTPRGKPGRGTPNKMA